MRSGWIWVQHCGRVLHVNGAERAADGVSVSLAYGRDVRLIYEKQLREQHRPLYDFFSGNSYLMMSCKTSSRYCLWTFVNIPAGGLIQGGAFRTRDLTLVILQPPPLSHLDTQTLIS